MSLELSREDLSIAQSDRSFASKVRAIHDRWTEAGETIDIRSRRTRAAQLAMLGHVHRWCVDCVGALREVYGDLVQLSDLQPDEQQPRFTIQIAADHEVSISLAPTRAASGDEWRVLIRLRYPEERNWVTPSWGRRNDNWTRSRVEEIVLSVLSAYERSRLMSRIP